MSAIHPTAIVDPGARLGAGVTVGPFTIIDRDVAVGEGTTIGAHNVITGHTTLGRGNRIFHFCSIGEANQDKKYRGEPTRLEVGDGNTFREYCTLHRGTAQDAGVTRIGDDNWFMAYSHVAHDCRVGSHGVFANGATLGGHVVVGDYATLGAFVGVHQFVKVGAHVMVGAGCILVQDLVPYVTAGGAPVATHGINAEGLRRCDFSAADIEAIKRAYRTLFRSGLPIAEAKSQVAAEAARTPVLAPIVAFLEASTRGILR